LDVKTKFAEVEDIIGMRETNENLYRTRRLAGFDVAKLVKWFFEILFVNGCKSD